MQECSRCRYNAQRTSFLALSAPCALAQPAAASYRLSADRHTNTAYSHHVPVPCIRSVHVIIVTYYGKVSSRVLSENLLSARTKSALRHLFKISSRRCVSARLLRSTGHWAGIGKGCASKLAAARGTCKPQVQSSRSYREKQTWPSLQPECRNDDHCDYVQVR
eukprot:6207798-Pleurochrysis_carterae.AAC.2